GYEEVTQQALLMPSGEVREFALTLPAGLEGQEEQERIARQRAAATTHSAAPLPVDQASLDLSIGWPYFGEVRLNVGLLDFLDAGFAIRSFGRLTEFEGRVRAGYRPLPLLSVGGQVRFGGGIGPEQGYGRPTAYLDEMGNEHPWTDPASGGVPDPMLGDRLTTRPSQIDAANVRGYPVNSAFLSLELLGSLHFSDQGAFTLWLAVDMSSDEYAGHPLNSSAYLDFGPDGEPYCVVQTDTRTRLNCPREDYARARLGGSLELVLTQHWNI